nr:MAG TPA: hypothetical protein [Bacteriophage sp.]
MPAYFRYAALTLFILASEMLVCANLHLCADKSSKLFLLFLTQL